MSDLAPNPMDATATPVSADASASDRARSLWSDAWDELKRNPLFWVSTVLLVLFILMAIVPTLFTNVDPTLCELKNARRAPSAAHIFGTDIQGCDVYARTIHGARSSILVGLFASLGTAVLGGLVGITAAYFGKAVDVILSRTGDIFFAIPLLLGGIIIMYTFPNKVGTPYPVIVAKVVLALTILGWPSLARIMRSSVLQVKPNDYVQAARALGASPWRIIRSHILPNALAPVVVIATINLGVYIAVEATLSFLGIGLQSPAISWGVAISEASGLGYVRSAPHMLLFPSLFLSLTVLAFILLGEAVRDALDPKLR